MERTKTLDSLYASNLIELSLDPLITISPEGKIIDMNQALINITGLEREKLLGSNFIDYFTEPKKANKLLIIIFKKGQITNQPLAIKNISNKVTDILVSGSVFKDLQGSVLGVVMVARNIAEQNWDKDLRAANQELAQQNLEKEKNAHKLQIAKKELVFQNKEKEKRAAELKIADKELKFQNIEKEKRAKELAIANIELDYQKEEKGKRAEELIIANIELDYQNEEKEKRAEELVIANYARSLIEASRDPLFTINLEGKITDMNNASVKITGVSRENLIGSHFFNYFTDPERARLVYQKVFANGYVVDYPLTIRDGKLTDVLFNGSVYKDNHEKVIGVVVVARDITERKRNEKELIEAKVFAELATLLAEEAKAKAEEAAETAENAVKAKQQFLSNMSHEIRTPMNAIIGFTKVVLKTELTAKQKEYLMAIKMSGDALIVLINDILDLAKVDAGKMIFEQTPFKMALSISAMLHLFEPKIHEKNLKLIKEYDKNIPDVLVGDPVRLHQIILNLVSNAVKFTTNGSITVSVRLIEETDENVTIEFSVSDTGIGISESKIGKIFENFQQASSGTSRLYGGTGLGLAIVKQLVEPQGGTIRVESKIDVGSTFSFVLSFLKTVEEIDSSIDFEPIDNQIKNITVLVVEDIPLNQLLMKTLLDEFGFDRDIASNGKIAIEKLKEKNYDIILMDLQMPEMNGFEATAYIRNTLHSKIPIIALTADVTTVDLAKCKAVGMNDYIAKPVDEKLLYGKIVSLLKMQAHIEEEEVEIKNEKCINLDYLLLRTKSNPTLMMEMISLYLDQTPILIQAMKQSLEEKDWNALYVAIHKMIPSFTIFGINQDYENIAKKIQEFTSNKEETDVIYDMVIQIENVCNQACIELEEEFNQIKKTNS
jgi:PAS domain S-box-containing protein